MIIGFEFHLRSSPSACSGYGWSVDQLTTSLLAALWWRDPTAVHDCNSWLSVWTLSCHCPVISKKIKNSLLTPLAVKNWINSVVYKLAFYVVSALIIVLQVLVLKVRVLQVQSSLRNTTCRQEAPTCQTLTLAQNRGTRLPEPWLLCKHVREKKRKCISARGTRLLG